jgi:hypothetical protein
MITDEELLIGIGVVIVGGSMLFGRQQRKTIVKHLIPLDQSLDPVQPYLHPAHYPGRGIQKAGLEFEILGHRSLFTVDTGAPSVHIDEYTAKEIGLTKHFKPKGTSDGSPVYHNVPITLPGVGTVIPPKLVVEGYGPGFFNIFPPNLFLPQYDITFIDNMMVFVINA